MISIKAKKLFSYLNPFEDLLPGQDTIFNKEAIRNYLLTSNIYHIEGDDAFENNYRKIAYLISNPNNLFLKINIPNNENDLKHMLVEENDNIFAFVALAYLNPDMISVDLSGNAKFAKTFFGTSQKEDFSFTQQALIVNNQSQKIDWNINENLLLETWRDKTFVLNNIDYSNIEANQKLIPPDFWNDTEFFEGILNKIDKYNHKNPEIFNFLMKHQKYNPLMLNYVFKEYNSFKIFKEYYFKDYFSYKNGNPVHENQSMIDSYLQSPSIFLSWLRNMHNQDIITHCFPENIWQNQETVVEWCKGKLSGSDCDFNPLLNNDYRSYKTLRNWIEEKPQEYKSELFDKLVDTYLNDKKTSNQYKSRNNFFDYSFNQLIFTKNFNSKIFYETIKDFYSLKQEVYISCFADFYKNSSKKPEICDELSNFIISFYPKHFNILDKKFRTLNNLKQLIPHDIYISAEEIQNFNDKELNLLLIENGATSTLLKAFPISYFIDEDYLLPLIKKNAITLKNKTLVNFIEKNTSLLKACIQFGHYESFSPKIFQNTELSEFLVGTVFSENYKHAKYNFSKESVFKIIHPSVLSNIDSLKNILTISRGNFLPKVQHLFKEKEFVKMVFSLYDEGKIHDTNLLPTEVRLVLDAYHVKENYLNFFNKFDLQANLHKKLSSDSSDKPLNKKTTNKI